MDLLGQPANLAEKSKGNNSMLEKQESAKVCSATRPASPVRMVKPRLVEPKFSEVVQVARRSMPDAATSQIAMSYPNAIIRRHSTRLLNALCDERPPMKGFKRMSWGPKRTRRLTSENAGSPKGRETYGDGAPVVVKT